MSRMVQECGIRIRSVNHIWIAVMMMIWYCISQRENVSRETFCIEKEKIQDNVSRETCSPTCCKLSVKHLCSQVMESVARFQLAFARELRLAVRIKVFGAAECFT